MSFMKYILNMCMFLPILLGLFLLVTKMTAMHTFNLSNKKYVKIIEKTLIAKDTYSLVMKIGDKAHVGISSPNGFQMIKELNHNELLEFESKLNPIQQDNNSNEFLQKVGDQLVVFINKATTYLKKQIAKQRRI